MSIARRPDLRAGMLTAIGVIGHLLTPVIEHPRRRLAVAQAKGQSHRHRNASLGNSI
jgi:hypothetical protein